MSKLAVALGLAALLALGLLLLVRSDESGSRDRTALGGPGVEDASAPARGPTDEPAREAVRPDVAEPAAGSPVSGPVLSERKAVEADPDPERTPAEPSEDAVPTVAVTGTVVVRDASGRAHGQEDGRLRFVVETERRKAHEVSVRAGAFALTVPEGALLSVVEVELGGRAAVLDPALERAPVPVQDAEAGAGAGSGSGVRRGRLALHARWPAAAVLRVVDAETGVDLAGLTVRRGAARAPQDVRRHPGRAPAGPVLFESAASPIELPAPTPAELAVGQATYFVRGPEHAWGSIEVDVRAGGERLLQLGRGGTLRVTILGEPPPGSRLSLRRRDSLTPFPDVEWPLEEDERVLEIPDLEAGGWLVQLVRGDLLAGAEVFAAGGARVAAGTTTDLELSPIVEPSSGPVPVEGRVVLSEGWVADESLRLLIVPYGTRGSRPLRSGTEVPLSPVGADGRAFVWSASLDPGEYRAVLEPYGYAQPFTVAPPSIPLVEVVLPLPSTVSLFVVDEATGLDTGVSSVAWAWVAPGSSALSFRRATRTAPGPIDFPAPSGTIRVFALEGGWSLPYTDVELRPGHNDVVVRAHATCGLELRLTDGDALLPIDWDGTVAVRQPGGEGQVVGFDGSGPGARYTLSEPGSYRVTVRELPGFRPVPDHDVVVPPGEFVELVIELEREP